MSPLHGTLALFRGFLTESVRSKASLFWTLAFPLLFLFVFGAVFGGGRRETVASLLPGEIIPAAKALHTNEALLAFLVIVTWHIYNSIFSPEVFPLDTAIFTGFISRERMVHEHPRELAELERKPVEEITSHYHGSETPHD